MNEHDGLLNFLTDGLVGRERDAVTRAFYGYAAGDPNSEPVGISVLLTACMRKLAQLPEKLQAGTAAYQKVLAEAREFEKGLSERVNRSNASVVAGFRDETARAKATWSETIEHLLRLLNNASDINKDLRPVIVSAKQIAQDFQALKGDLKLHEDSTKKIVEGVEEIKVIHQENQIIHQENQALIKRMSKEARANWITIGLFGGIVLAAIFPQLPSWGPSLSIAGTVGLIQGFSRLNWKFVRKQAKKISPPVETKPAG